MASEFPVISKEELEQQGIAIVSFEGLTITPLGRANGQIVYSKGM